MTDCITRLQASFPALHHPDDAALGSFLAAGHCVSLPAGTPLFHAGDDCRSYLLVLEGLVPVRLLGENGREVTLYVVGPGDSCVLTTACLLGDKRYTADAVTATPVTACVFDRAAFERAVDGSPAFRRFVFAHLAERLGNVITRLDEIAFGAIDRRIARTLLAAGGCDVRQTHAALAMSTGTVREVVSRHLKRYEARGWVRLGRGLVQILDVPAIQRMAAGHGAV